MTERNTIAVIGSGPAGLSAAGRAAQLGLSHVLLEQTDHISDTIFKYQKSKLVMATPDNLPVRSTFSFKAGAREEVLEIWNKNLKAHEINILFGAEVTSIKGEKGKFEIKLRNKPSITVKYVIMAIGVQGNIRRLDVPGAADLEHSFVQYQLDDPEEFEDEVIVVVGAGDAAIENAIALAKQNRVILDNRRDGFERSKQRNLNLVVRAIEHGEIDCYYDSVPIAVTSNSITLHTPEGDSEIVCDRVIARLGAIPPRKFVEACGVKFPNDDPDSLPVVGTHYESNVSGLYIIGALSGYPLIKQAMNQGYEVVEFINGNLDLKPTDEPLIEKKIRALPGVSVDDFLSTVRRNIPVFRELNNLLLRELMLDTTVHIKEPGEVIFDRNDVSNSFYAIYSGQVDVLVDPDEPNAVATLSRGDFFGEMGLISGRRRSATVVARNKCVLLEASRRSIIKLINSVPEVRRAIDEGAVIRQIQVYLAPQLSNEDLKDVAKTARLCGYQAGDVLFEEGSAGDSMHIIRRGSVTVSRYIGGREMVLAYVAAGNYVGEMALLANLPRIATVRAAVNNTETIRIESSAFADLTRRAPDDFKQWMRAKIVEYCRQNARALDAPEASSILEFLVAQGATEATDILLIDESLCIGCDNCETACAATHDGISRLDREAGPTFAKVHVPTSCRHCEHPHCMKDCPPDAIHRGKFGEVYINDSCIGCGNCEQNCPYGVIQMAMKPPPKPGLLIWLLFGLGPRPGQDKTASGEGEMRAVKCDMCKDIDGGAACVRACPTGAAIRTHPKNFLNIANLASWPR